MSNRGWKTHPYRNVKRYMKPPSVSAAGGGGTDPAIFSHDIYSSELSSGNTPYLINGNEHLGNPMGPGNTHGIFLRVHPQYALGDISFVAAFIYNGAFSADTHTYEYGTHVNQLSVVPATVATQGTFNVSINAANRLFYSPVITVTPAGTPNVDGVLQVRITRTDSESNDTILIHSRVWYDLT